MPVNTLALIVITFGMGYFLSYFLRNVNAILSPIIVDEFSFAATDIGLLTGAYFIMAALVLIPVAMLLDRFGPRRMLIAQLLVVATGCAVFATGDGTTSLLVGRALIGAGAAGCLTTAFKAVTIWFPRDRWATGNSFVLGVGSLGVITGTQPLQWLLQLVDWREVFWLCAAVSLTVAALAFFAVPERNSPPSTTPKERVFARVLTLPVFWRIVPVASLTMAVYFAIQGLWANAWMADVAGLSQVEIGQRLLVMALAMSCGMLLNGSIADMLNTVGVPLAAVMAVGIICLLLAELVLVLELAPRAWWPWAAMGYTGNIGALGYPLISRRFPSSGSARAMSLLAMSNFALAFIVMTTLGGVLDVWGNAATGAYPAEAYSLGIGIFLALQGLTFLWFLASREVWVNPKIL